MLVRGVIFLSFLFFFKNNTIILLPAPCGIKLHESYSWSIIPSVNTDYGLLIQSTFYIVSIKYAKNVALKKEITLSMSPVCFSCFLVKFILMK